MAHALVMPSIFTPVAGDRSDGGRLALPVYRCDCDTDDVSGL
jgi:hypothetical protein